jgi:ribose-phosphate pyrophosphokinase
MRKDRRTKPRDPLTTRYLAQLFEAVGTQRIVALDVHNPAAFENAFRIPTEHLSARAELVRSVIPLIGERPAVVVSPDAGGFKRAEAFRQVLERILARPVGFGFVEKFRSEGIVRGSAVAGDFAGRVAVIVDDLISTGGTLVRAALACRERGACAAYAAVTHGVFAPGAAGALENAALDRIVICDTIPPSRLEPELVRRRLEVIDCSALVAACIKRLHEGGSLSELS